LGGARNKKIWGLIVNLSWLSGQKEEGREQLKEPETPQKKKPGRPIVGIPADQGQKKVVEPRERTLSRHFQRTWNSRKYTGDIMPASVT